LPTSCATPSRTAPIKRVLDRVLKREKRERAQLAKRLT
jgi:hypothetical protein